TEQKQALPSPKKIDRLEALLKELRFPENSREAIRKRAQKATQDPVVDLLEEFFSDRQWGRFLDRRRRARRTKLPSLTEARVNLVDAFLHPEKTFWFRGPHPQGLSLLPSEAYHLAAQCMKAAFPRQCRGETGESLKHTYLYHQRLRNRPKGPPRGYGRF
ncbi:MAG: hypothetical protein V3R16_11135, partial [Nitrospirales bacterium]